MTPADRAALKRQNLESEARRDIASANTPDDAYWPKQVVSLLAELGRAERHAEGNYEEAEALAARERALMAERDQLKAELEGYKAEMDRVQDTYDLEDELAAARAEIKRLWEAQEAVHKTAWRANIRWGRTVIERNQLRELCSKAWRLLDVTEPNADITSALFNYLAEHRNLGAEGIAAGHARGEET